MIPELKRPLLSFKDWLEQNADVARGEGFEAFADLVQRTQGQDISSLSPDEQALARMWAALGLAVVEVCNVEFAKFGRTEHQVIQLLPRALACAAFYATA